MARRRLTPAQPGYLAPAGAPETKSMLPPLAAAPPIAKVSGQSAEAAALRDLVEGIEAARAEGRMIVEVPLADVAPGHLLRERIALDRGALDELKASIRTHGQRIPAEITPIVAAADGDGLSPYRFGLISGWRRLRALSELHDETGEARFSTLRALIRPGAEGAAAYVAMVEENEIRVGLSYYERARLVAETARRGVFPDQSAALRTLFAAASRAKRSKIASFIDIHERLGDVLRFPAEIPERLGLALVSRLRLDGPKRLRAALAEAPPADAESELALLERLSQTQKPPAARTVPAGEKLAAGLTLRAVRKGRTVTLTLSGAEVDDGLLERARTLLRQLPTRG